MKKILNKIDWIWDYYFVYFLYNANKIKRYHNYMAGKWGEKYTNYGKRNG